MDHKQRNNIRLLVITQKVDADDALLGFMHRWLGEFSKHFESIVAIGLGKGTVSLPANVAVMSLGKETKPSRLHYVLNFYRYIWRERKNYDAVFVHMNQEYVLLGALLWKILGKKIYLWRNHPMGDFSTRLAVILSTKVFATSKKAYTMRFKKTSTMPVGIDTEFFKRDPSIRRDRSSILYLGRVSPVKHIGTILKGIKELKKPITLVGEPMPYEKAYGEEMKKLASDLGIESLVTWGLPVSNTSTVEYYNSFGILVNATPTGSFDKTMFEGMACEQVQLVSNKVFKGEIDERLIFAEDDPNDLAERARKLLSLSAVEYEAIGAKLRQYVVDNHSLASLARKLKEVIK